MKKFFIGVVEGKALPKVLKHISSSEDIVFVKERLISFLNDQEANYVLHLLNVGGISNQSMLYVEVEELYMTQFHLQTNIKFPEMPEQLLSKLPIP